MEFEFRIMDFDDTTSLTNYGIEVLEELSQININGNDTLGLGKFIYESKMM